MTTCLSHKKNMPAIYVLDLYSFDTVISLFISGKKKGE